MANDKNITTFTIIDIEKYHKGLLSAKEMHTLEKAALDDPFLADALEGYAVSGIDINADIAELKKRLTKRTEEEAKVVPIAVTKRSNFNWWKVAAMVILIAGAGLIVYQFGLNKKEAEIAQSTRKENPVETTKDSEVMNPSTPVNADSNASLMTKEKTEEKKTSSTRKNLSIKSQSKPAPGKDAEAANESAQPVQEITTANAPATVAAEEKEEKLNDAIAKQRMNTTKRSAYKAKSTTDSIVNEAPVDKNLDGRIAGVAASRQRQQAFAQNNVFRGRVTDEYNNALPFSNITNTEDGIGTYSDARGYFTLTSPDSVLNVQVRSLGFENNKMQLQNNIPNNQVQLQEDRSSLAEVVISNKKVNSKRDRNNTMVLEEPEPADGWTNYDLYLANNLKTPEVFKDKETNIRGEVELSFEVDKNGVPFNITVKKSLCQSCDKEAIRLVKEGPKWKRKAKKGRATVKISF